MDAGTTTARKRPIAVILEDDHGVRRSLQLLLQGKNFEVKAHASATALLADPEVLNASCLIADFILSELDGITVLETLRRRGWAGPALLMTAFGTEQIADRARAAGFCEILAKPFRDHALLNALGRVMVS